jgi:aminopeptidase N
MLPSASIRRKGTRTRGILLLAGAACCGAGPVGAAAQHVFGNPAVSQRPPERTYHVTNYKLTLHFDQTTGEVFGDEVVALEPLGPGFKRFYLNSSGLSIESVALSGGQRRDLPLPFSSGASRLWITLDHAYGRGDTLRVEIKYHGSPRAGLYFVNPSAMHPDAPREIWSQGEPEFNHFWFPCWDYPNDMSTSEMVVTVPAGQSVVSNGRLVSVTKHGDQVTYDWLESVPHSSYLTSLAIGPWRKVSDHEGRLPVDYYVPDTVSDATARRSFHLTPDMIGFFSNSLGVPYPYEQYAQVTVSQYFFGGMENVSATTLTDTTLHDARADPDYSSQALVAHELGQHWFGDLVQGRDWADIWLNEGFATYLEALYAQYHEGDDEFRLQMMQDQESAKQQDEEDYVRPIVDDHYTDPLQMFDSITHEKGAVVLDMLRNMLDGEAAAARPASQRELFFRALRSYLTKYRAQAVGTAALTRTLETSTGRKLDWFFREWVYMAGHPDYRVRARYDAGARIERLSVEQTQAGPGVTGAFVMPVQVEFHGANGESRRVSIDDQKRLQAFEIPLRFKPLWVDFDPRDIIEKTLVFSQPVDALAAKAQRDPAMMSRISAVRQLGSVTGSRIEAAVSALSAALEHDAFYGVRTYAAISLGELHTQTAESALLAALAEPDSRVRVGVVEALATFRGDSDAYHALLGKLNSDPSYAVQAAAAKAIGSFGTAHAVSALERVVERGSDSHVMEGVFEGLAATRDPRAFSVLLTHARAGMPLTLRLEALRALERPGHALSKRDRDALVTALRAALDDPDLSIRQTGEEIAGAWHLNELGPQISKLARTAPTGFERDSADEALRQLRPHTAARPGAG